MKYTINQKLTTITYKNIYALTIEFMHGDAEYDTETTYANPPNAFDEIIEFLNWYDKQPYSEQRKIYLTDFKPFEDWSEQMQGYIEYGDSFIPRDKFSNYLYNAVISSWGVTYFDNDGNEWSVTVDE